MTPNLARFTQTAKQNPKLRFNSLMGLLTCKDGLHASFGRQPAGKAVGVDGVRKEDYQRGLGERIAALSGSLRRLGYRPQPARRVYIPKANGGRRPLGIPSFEDRIVQDRLSQILQAIWEPEFRDCSYGFRPNRSAHDALRQIAKVITHGKVSWVVEADIKGFFNAVHHDHMLRFVEHRIADPHFLRILRRFLKAGIMEDGAFVATDTGTPQGGLVSPVLSNIYLHYVLDLWFEKKFRKTCQGEAHLVRYADDFLACFAHQADAERFHRELSERLAQFALEVEPSKTKRLRFGRFAQQHCHKDGLERPETFTFLGFTHYVSTSRSGQFLVGRRTDTQRMRRKLRELKERLKSLRIKGGRAMTDYLRLHLLGYQQYYGVSGNSGPLRAYTRQAAKLLFKWLNRRSQRRSITWARFLELWKQGYVIPKPRIVHHLYPEPTRTR
jgi:group II intron reverse transcriptase/maturase